jgi:hypothetical protein
LPCADATTPVVERSSSVADRSREPARRGAQAAFLDGGDERLQRRELHAEMITIGYRVGDCRICPSRGVPSRLRRARLIRIHVGERASVNRLSEGDSG